MVVDFSEYFDLEPQICYLNHAAVSPWPIRCADAVRQFADNNRYKGSLDYLQWLEIEKETRQQLQRLIHAKSVDEIAFVKNTSEGLSIVAYGLDWNHGDSIVGTDQEFPSNRIVWESLSTKGVGYRAAALNEYNTPEEAIFAQVDGHTRLIAVSSVMYGTGLRLDLERIGNFCKEHGIFFCVDAIQSVGAVQIDVEKCAIDFLSADGHKWMMAPEGLGLFYCKEASLPQLDLNQYGWHMIEEVGDYDQQQWQVAKSARRFECGSPNMVAIHALNASLSIIEEVGADQIEAQVLESSRYLMNSIDTLEDYQVITPQAQDRFAGIVTIKPLKQSTDDLFHRLSNEGIFCAKRGGGVRFSPHFYTPRQKLDYLLQSL